MKRNLFILILIFLISINVSYSKVPKITFKPSYGTVLTKTDVENILKENNLTKFDKFECIIDNSVTRIGEDAFFCYFGMVKLTLSNNLISIEKNAFRSTRFSNNIIFPESLEIIGRNAFDGCEQLKSITFPKNSNLRILDDWCFCRTLISEVILPKNLREIGCYPFSDSDFKNYKKKLIHKQLRRITFLSSEPPKFSSIFTSLYQYNSSKTTLTIKVPKGAKEKYINSLRNVQNWDKYPNSLKVIE